jgi:hypothetical protein
VLTLYDVEVKNTEGIDGFTSTEIFTTGGSDEVWGMKGKEELCNPFSFSAYDASVDYSLVKNPKQKNLAETSFEKVDRKYNLPTVKVKSRKRTPKNSIHLKTDKNPACEWIGMGIGWDGWQGKDMSGIMEKSAIELMVRVEKGSITRLPIVFILEDYSENQCYATASYLGIEGGKIDQSWTRVVVPLQTFSYIKNKIDLTNVKQLLLQCYDATDVYLDNIQIIKYNHPYKRLEENLTVYDSISPIPVFSNSLDGTWGIESEHCNNFSLKTKKDNSFISVKTDSTKCDWLDFGISWNNWLYTDISKSVKDFSLQLDIKGKSVIPFTISFEDYAGKKLSYQFWNGELDIPNWKNVSIPLYKFPIRKSKIDLTKIKQIHFKFAYETDLSIDNIQLTKN